MRRYMIVNRAGDFLSQTGGWTAKKSDAIYLGSWTLAHMVAKYNSSHIHTVYLT